MSTHEDAMSSDDGSNVDQPAVSPQQTQQQIQALADRVEDLESELRAERERRQELEEQLEAERADTTDECSEIEWRGEAGDAEIANLWIGNYPIGKIINSTEKDVSDLRSRVDDLEAGEVDASAVEPDEDALPIQQMRAAVKAGRDDLSANQRRATVVWAEFFDAADPSGKKYTITSAKVKQILDDHDERSDPNTRRRVMENVELFTDGLVDREKNKGTWVLAADKDEVEEWHDNLVGGDE